MGVDPPPRGAFGCWWWWGGCPTGAPHLSPPLQDGGTLADDARAMAQGAEVTGVTDGLVVTPWHLWQRHRPCGCKPGDPGVLLPPPPAPSLHPGGTAGTGGHQWAVGAVGSGHHRREGDPGGRLDFQGSLEPADSGSVILRGMQFPQQQRVRGQRGEPAAPLGIAIMPPLPKSRRGEVPGRGAGARCWAGRRGRGGEGRRRCGGRAGRGGGQAGAAGEAASGSVWRCQQRCH